MYSQRMWKHYNERGKLRLKRKRRAFEDKVSENHTTKHYKFSMLKVLNCEKRPISDNTFTQTLNSSIICMCFIQIT